MNERNSSEAFELLKSFKLLHSYDFGNIVVFLDSIPFLRKKKCFGASWY